MRKFLLNFLLIIIVWPCAFLFGLAVLFFNDPYHEELYKLTAGTPSELFVNAEYHDNYFKIENIEIYLHLVPTVLKNRGHYNWQYAAGPYELIVKFNKYNTETKSILLKELIVKYDNAESSIYNLKNVNHEVRDPLSKTDKYGNHYSGYTVEDHLQLDFKSQNKIRVELIFELTTEEAQKSYRLETVFEPILLKGFLQIPLP